MDLKSVTSRTSSSGVSLITMDCGDLDRLNGRDGLVGSWTLNGGGGDD